ncbi:MAG: hypothetical protein HONDAALG_03763 [Gammaproteobacteria bacterium]|nr:hypothetical protein [Gammaproteobacteria bacterium]
MPDLAIQLSHSLARVHGIKAVQPQAQPGVLDVLIAPFWGPNNGRDAHGQYFTPETEFMHDVIPTPPVFYYHGAEMGEAPTPIGKSADRWVDDLGVWQTVMLDMADPTARRTWQASLAGNAYASTGVVPASLMLNAQTGEIEQWLIGEISLMVLSDGQEPANTYAIALPRLKALRKSLEPERRKLFDQMYQIQGAKAMDVIEKLQAVFARFIEELSAELDISTDEAADIIEEAADEGADIATGDAECTDCDAADVGDAVDALIEAVDDADADAEPVIAKSAAALRRENARLRAKLARQADNNWLSKQVSAKRLTPAERPAVMEALVKARASGKSGSATAAAIRSMIEARPASGQRTSIKAAGMSQAGFSSPANGAGIDPATLARMKSYAGME